MPQSLADATASQANCNVFPISTSLTVFTDSLPNLSSKTGNLHATTDGPANKQSYLRANLDFSVIGLEIVPPDSLYIYFLSLATNRFLFSGSILRFRSRWCITIRHRDLYTSCLFSRSLKCKM
jgi:hypothetical protein